MALRSGFYIDGFNFFHAIDDLYDTSLKWVSYWQIAQMIQNRNESIEFVKVFSAQPHFKPWKVTRHNEVIKATESEGVQWILGEFTKSTLKCKKCNRKYRNWEEKQTDVAIGVTLVHDCLMGLVDVVYLVTADSDIIPAIQLIKSHAPDIQIVSVSPPGRGQSRKLEKLSHRTARVTPGQLYDCRMPERIVGLDGKTIAVRPAEYAPWF